MKKNLIIAEIGINHNGDMELAKHLIDKAKNAGCDAVKFQKRTIENVYTKEELDKPRESPFGTTNREQKEGLEFSIEQYKELEEYTKKKRLKFIVSCWDLNSLKLIEENLNVKYHKVASALLTDKNFLLALNETKKPFGDPNRNWNSEDSQALITNEISDDKNLIIDLDFSSLNDETLEDKSGNQNKGMVIGDYKIFYEDGTRKPSRGDINLVPKIGKEDSI